MENVPPMRTGFHQDTENEMANTFIDNHMILLAIFLEDSMRLAASYCEHAGRRGVTSTDINLAMMVRAVHGPEFWNRPDIQQKIEETRQGLSEMSDSESEATEGATEGATEAMEPWTASTHNCSICNSLNQITPIYNNWNPTDRVDITIKAAIERALRKAEQYNDNNR